MAADAGVTGDVAAGVEDADTSCDPRGAAARGAALHAVLRAAFLATVFFATLFSTMLLSTAPGAFSSTSSTDPSGAVRIHWLPLMSFRCACPSDASSAASHMPQPDCFFVPGHSE